MFTTYIKYPLILLLPSFFIVLVIFQFIFLFLSSLLSLILFHKQFCLHFILHSAHFLSLSFPYITHSLFFFHHTSFQIFFTLHSKMLMYLFFFAFIFLFLDIHIISFYNKSILFFFTFQYYHFFFIPFHLF